MQAKAQPTWLKTIVITFMVCFQLEARRKKRQEDDDHYYWWQTKENETHDKGCVLGLIAVGKVMMTEF